MLLEQLTLFPNVSIALEDAVTHRSSLRSSIKIPATRRQSDVNAGTMPESTNARTQGRPMAGFRGRSQLSTLMKAYREYSFL